MNGSRKKLTPAVLLRLLALSAVLLLLGSSSAAVQDAPGESVNDLSEVPDVEVKVLARARLGNVSEDVAAVHNAGLKSQVAILDGEEVWGLAVDADLLGASQKREYLRAQKLFDLHALPHHGHATGIAYIATEGLFVLNDSWQVTTLFLFDSLGHLQGTINVEYLGGFVPCHIEGLAYIPEDSPVYPDHLVLVAWNCSPYETRLQIVRRDGQVVDEIVPGGPAWGYFAGPVTFFAPNRLLVGFYGESYVLDFAGNVVDGPLTPPRGLAFEGLAQLPDGRIAAADPFSGTVHFYDEEFCRLETRGDSHLGVSTTPLDGAAWDDATRTFLILHRFSPENRVEAVPLGLDRARQVLDLEQHGLDWGRGLTYLPGEELIAVAHQRSPEAILLFDGDGNWVEQIDTTWVGGRPLEIEFLPGTNEFAVSFQWAGQQLAILSRWGDPVRTIDLTATGIGGPSAFAFFDPDHPSGGRFLIFGWGSKAGVADYDGNLIGAFDFREAFGAIFPRDVALITSGPYEGAFVLVSSMNSEVVVFTLN